MPMYQYQCRQCGFETEELQSMSETPLTHCPRCYTENLARILGTGAGLIFKGSGFYLTDYKKAAAGTSESPGEKKQDEKKQDEKKQDEKKQDEKIQEAKQPEKKEKPKDSGGSVKK